MCNLPCVNKIINSNIKLHRLRKGVVNRWREETVLFSLQQTHFVI